MTDEQRHQQPPEPEGEQRQQPPPEPPPWPTLGANYNDPPPQPRTAPTAPRPETDQGEWWQEPPRSEWAQPPVHAPWAQPQAPNYPGARISDSEARNWAMAAHLSPLLASLVGLPFLGPLIVWLAKRDDHPYIAEQAREALNFNLSMFIYMIAALFSMILLIGFLLVPVLGVVWLVLSVIAAVKASNGEPYRYPFTIRMVN